MNPIISLQEISKSYFYQSVLKNVTLNIYPNSFVGLLGKNGAGKSTLLNILMGITRPDQGFGSILGTSLNDNTHQHKQYIGHVSEAIDYDLPVSVEKFINYFKDFYTNWDQKLFNHILEERNIPTNKRFKNYSRGQKIQISLAMNLAFGPKILLADEITSMLDLQARSYFMDKLSDFVKNGGTVILTTNIISEIHNKATDLVILNEGIIELNLKMNQLEQVFKKLQFTKDQNHPILDHPKCGWVGTEEDLTYYLIPTQDLQENNDLEKYYGEKPIRPEDVFIYFHHIRSLTESTLP